MRRTMLMSMFVFSAAIFCALASQGYADSKNEETWLELKPDMFGNRSITENDAVIGLNAPVRAEDAAIVPIEIVAKFAQSSDRYIKAITLIIDENPAPVVASFSFGPASPQASLTTRVRVDSYSFVRAIAEMNDGSLHMVKRYVKAAGGCSAPAGKDQDKAMAEMGKMKLRQFPVETKSGQDAATMRNAQLMIRHPNNSGLQMNQVTMLYIPAHYVSDIEVRAGGELVFAMQGGISLSEDPNIRFAFKAAAKDEIAAVARDTQNNRFEQRWPVDAAGS